MNRRGFFTSLAASSLVAVASRTRLAETILPLTEDPIGQRYAEHLARSLVETKETLTTAISGLFP